jgi:hypothetical protein
MIDRGGPASNCYSPKDLPELRLLRDFALASEAVINKDPGEHQILSDIRRISIAIGIDRLTDDILDDEVLRMTSTVDIERDTIELKPNPIETEFSEVIVDMRKSPHFREFDQIPLETRKMNKCERYSKIDLQMLQNGDLQSMTVPDFLWTRGELDRLCEFGAFLAKRLPLQFSQKLANRKCKFTCLRDVTAMIP